MSSGFAGRSLERQGSSLATSCSHVTENSRSVPASFPDDNQVTVTRKEGKVTGGASRSFLPPLSLKGQWNCDTCQKTCLVIREECRCLCGHRLKEHTKGLSDRPDSSRFACANGKCKCRDFYYIVAEGAWILRCKHKHIEHDPVTFKCTRTTCNCTKFDSPWVCNCNHPWKAHKQIMAKPALRSGSSLLSQQPASLDMASDLLEIGKEVNNLDDIRRDPLAGSEPVTSHRQDPR
ncbi:loc549482 related [Cystoisospora suis]|uniref:Protein FAM221A n=1 Tax=Cystoisospora suis TaxID=483139 RepID=A0A2C6KUR8_9APIC|nr:loc549482 related [Cystoisospora suis]